MYDNVEPISVCNRGFGVAATATEPVPTILDWPEPGRFVVTVGNGLLQWDMQLEPTTGTGLHAVC